MTTTHAAFFWLSIAENREVNRRWRTALALPPWKEMEITYKVKKLTGFVKIVLNLSEYSVLVHRGDGGDSNDSMWLRRWEV